MIWLENNETHLLPTIKTHFLLITQNCSFFLCASLWISKKPKKSIIFKINKHNHNKDNKTHHLHIYRLLSFSISIARLWTTPLLPKKSSEWLYRPLFLFLLSAAPEKGCESMGSHIHPDARAGPHLPALHPACWLPQVSAALPMWVIWKIELGSSALGQSFHSREDIFWISTQQPH